MTRMRGWLWGLTLAVLAAASGGAQAAIPKDFFQVSVPVADRESTDRQAAIREALGILLVRLSGDPAIAKQGPAQAVLQRSRDFVQRYQYIEVPPAATAAPSGLRLTLLFDGQSLESAMRAAGLPVWGRERPAILAWIAVDEGGRRRLLSATDASPLRTGLEAAAQRYGLPLVLPLMDLEDQASVPLADIWGGFVDALREPSRRYQPQGLLLGRIWESGGGWTARWILDFNGEQLRWQHQAGSAQALIEEGVAELARRLAARLAVRSGAEPARLQTVTVEGIDSLEDMARVIGYLQQLSMVDSVELSRVAGGRAEFELMLNGGLQYLQQAIALGRVLQFESQLPAPLYRLQN